MNEADKIAEAEANAKAAEDKRAVRVRKNAIETKLSEYIESDEGEVAIKMMVRKLITNGAGDRAIEFIAYSVYEYMRGYGYGAAVIITAFPGVAAEAGITADDAGWYLAAGGGAK